MKPGQPPEVVILCKLIFALKKNQCSTRPMVSMGLRRHVRVNGWPFASYYIFMGVARDELIKS
jgi:hypothetical protein